MFKKSGLKQKWLNLILRFSSLIYRQKNSLIYAGFVETFLKVIFILILEITLSIFSLPFYFFVAPDEDHFGAFVKAYRLRRKLTFAVLLSFIIFQVFGTLMTTLGFGIFYNYLIYGGFQ